MLLSSACMGSYIIQRSLPQSQVQPTPSFGSLPGTSSALAPSAPSHLLLHSLTWLDNYTLNSYLSADMNRFNSISFACINIEDIYNEYIYKRTGICINMMQGIAGSLCKLKKDVWRSLFVFKIQLSKANPGDTVWQLCLAIIIAICNWYYDYL